MYRGYAGDGFRLGRGSRKGGPFGPYRQSLRSEFYLHALRTLFDLGCIYPCLKSRSEISDAGILAASGKEYIYPEYFRPDSAAPLPLDFPGNYNWRFSHKWGCKGKIYGHKKSRTVFSRGKRFV